MNHVQAGVFPGGHVAERVARSTLVSPMRWSEDETPRDLAARVRGALTTVKAVHITGVRPKIIDLRWFYEEVQDGIGVALRIGEDAKSGVPTGERWIGIRYDSSMPDRYRHARVAQPLHTDYAYTRDNPELALMYCVRQASRGGESIFVDAEDVVTLLKTLDPPLLAELQAREVAFVKAGRGKLDRVITRDERGTLLTWLATCVDREQAAEVRDMAARFARFVACHVETSPHVVAIRLAPGEAVVWHDRRVLHGRAAFEAREDGDRLLWKSGIFLSARGGG